MLVRFNKERVYIYCSSLKKEVKTVSGYGGRGSGFALIVVLFILLIIVGAFYWNY